MLELLEFPCSSPTYRWPKAQHGDLSPGLFFIERLITSLWEWCSQIWQNTSSCHAGMSRGQNSWKNSMVQRFRSVFFVWRMCIQKLTAYKNFPLYAPAPLSQQNIIATNINCIVHNQSPQHQHQHHIYTHICTCPLLAWHTCATQIYIFN